MTTEDRTAIDAAALAQDLAAQGGRLTFPQAAVSVVESGQRVMIPIGSQPLLLADALATHIASLPTGSVEVGHCAVAANYLWLEPGFPGIDKVVHEHWGGPAVRRQLREHAHDHVPIPFSLQFKALAVATGYAGHAEQMHYARLNPRIHTRPTEYVHNIRVIASQDNMVALNAALCVDLTGQIAADSIGSEMIGGTGGQLEFAIGALNARNGRSITVLESRALSGSVSTIVDLLPAGTVVTVPRQFADIVVTEFGVARLWAKSLRERAQELIAIAHPEFRDQLRQRATELLG